MNPRVKTRPAALFDLEEIAVQIGRDRPRTALKFLDAAEKTFELLGLFPQLGAVRFSLPHAVQDIRCYPVKRFRKFLVLYRTTADGVEIIRVVHGARDLSAIFGVRDPD